MMIMALNQAVDEQAHPTIMQCSHEHVSKRGGDSEKEDSRALEPK
jgi:hypothetical protein